ncbi:hypothetical protein ABFS82_12G085300 [Erythranthe guttata]|uniref:BZIP domain-containing protein n=1 Tax=Erythranthe guttata TaxID=4155 RepID=A0A022QQZ8_ERYGU|nr:PREDICTED: basic leucine zipper 43 [Erythranthe guttata]EYU28915.1 hypothetical protein MIMGU_mgv1a014639mg [Erythranthe guttata]|eukprot:XP_012847538.1 PREDICTED: basic leucine zipper 43 [Erythranthe guttata]
MMQSEIQEMHYFAPQNPSPYQPNFNLIQNTSPSMQYNRFVPANLPNYPPISLLNELCPNSNSTSDEAEDNQVGLVDERKQRRMISNRESARRSRMRKQRHLDELWGQVLRLRNENQNLVEKLSHVSESHGRVVEENARLKEEASDLRQMLMDAQISNSYAVLRDFEDLESSEQSVVTSKNLFD